MCVGEMAGARRLAAVDPVAGLEVLGRIPEGGQKEAVHLSEAIPDRFGRGMEAWGRRLLDVGGSGERSPPEDRSELGGGGA